MQDGTPWPGNNVRDHPGMIQVMWGIILTDAIFFLYYIGLLKLLTDHLLITHPFLGLCCTI